MLTLQRSWKDASLTTFCMLILCILSSCSSGPPPQQVQETVTPVIKNGSFKEADCKAGLPDYNDVTKASDTCGIGNLTIQKKGAIPIVRSVGVVKIDLYIKKDTECAAQVALCLLGDNRSFVNTGDIDPKANALRNRAEITLDFRTGDLSLVVSPSCRIHVGIVGINDTKTCTAPRKEGNGNNFSFSIGRTGAVRMTLQIIQSDYPSPFNICDIYDEFNVTPHLDTGMFDLIGAGTNFPDLAVMQNGKVVYADNAKHSTISLCTSVLHKRDYRYVTDPLGQAETLETVDWKNYTYTSICYGGSVHHFTLSNGQGSANGMSELSLSIAVPVYGDLDDDGQFDVLIPYSCSMGGTMIDGGVFVFTGNKNGPLQIGEIRITDPGNQETAAGQSASINKKNGDIVITGIIHSSPNIPHCCGDELITNTYHWIGGSNIKLVNSTIVPLVTPIPTV